MKDKDLFKKLQDKTYVRAFGLMTPVERTVLIGIGKKNCLYYGTNGWTKCTSETFINFSTYAIKPDYQPEPEFVDLEITKCSNSKGIFYLGCWIRQEPGANNFVHLSELPSLQNFECFYYWKQTSLREVSFDDVSTRISRDKETVFARFRT